jgi:hypothetical protein
MLCAVSHFCRGLPVPHIGWNTLDQLRASDLLAAAAPSDRVYYVHSYRCDASSREGGNSVAGAEQLSGWDVQPLGLVDLGFCRSQPAGGEVCS